MLWSIRLCWQYIQCCRCKVIDDNWMQFIPLLCPCFYLLSTINIRWTSVYHRRYIHINTSLVLHTNIKKHCRTGNDNMGSLGLIPINFYLINGWSDINITAISTNRYGNMSCGSEYAESCTIQDAAKGTDPWVCDGQGQLECETYAPTSAPIFSVTEPTPLPEGNLTYPPLISLSSTVC